MSGTGRPARPPPGTLLCRLDEIGDPGSLGFSFKGEDGWFAGFVVRKGAVVTGYVDRCPHVGTPLALSPTGFLTRAGEAILCSSHGALFRIEDGLCTAGPCAGKRLSPWLVTVQDGAVTSA